MFNWLALTALIGMLSADLYGQRKPPPAAKPLPNLSLKAIDGRQWNLADLRGRVVVLNFWATWCAPCRSEIPVLQRLSNKYEKAGLSVVGVSVDGEDTDSINRFINDLKIEYPIVLAKPGSLLAEQEAIPMSLLIDEKGVLTKKYIGAVEQKILEADIKKLLAEKSVNEK